MISLTQKQQIIQLHLSGETNRAIAKRLKISKDTVNKYVNEYNEERRNLLTLDPSMDNKEIIQSFVEKPTYDASKRYPIKRTPEIIGIVEACLELNRKKREKGMHKQQMKVIDIYEHLQDLGKDISYTSVKRIVRKIDKTSKEAFIRQEYTPGDVCEFDWGVVKLNINGEGYKKYQMAVFTPAYSNYRFAYLFRFQNTAAFQEAHGLFFKHCKGSYRTMVYDNMKVAIKSFVGLTEKEPTTALTELSVYYGFNYRFCNIASGNEKGHVEKSVDFVRRKAFSGPEKDCFDSLSEANIYLLDECAKLNKRPISGSLIPSNRFEEEAQVLLPDVPMFVSCIKTTGRVDKYSTITFAQNRYSVPDHLVGRRLPFRVYSDTIVIYDDGVIVAKHERSYKNHDWRIDIMHYLKTFKQKKGALTNSTALLQADTSIKKIFTDYYNSDAKTFLEVLEIVYEKGIDPVMHALMQLEKLSPSDMSSAKVRMLCDNAEPMKVGHDSISEIAHASLSHYDLLRTLQTQHLVGDWRATG